MLVSLYCFQVVQKEVRVEKQLRAAEVASLAADKSSAEERSEALETENSALQARSQASHISKATRKDSEREVLHI